MQQTVENCWMFDEIAVNEGRRQRLQHLWHQMDLTSTRPMVLYLKGDFKQRTEPEFLFLTL